MAEIEHTIHTTRATVWQRVQNGHETRTSNGDVWQTLQPVSRRQTVRILSDDGADAVNPGPGANQHDIGQGLLVLHQPRYRHGLVHAVQEPFLGQRPEMADDSPEVESGKLKDTYCQINECGDQMVSSIVETIGKKTEDRIELKTISGRFSTDVIATCAFGLKLDSIKNGDSEFRRYVEMLFRTTPKQTIVMVLSLICPMAIKIFGLQFFSVEASNFFSKVFADVIKYREDHDVVRNDITQTLIQARKELVLKEVSTTEGIAAM